jgi:hypothetical protein
LQAIIKCYSLVVIFHSYTYELSRLPHSNIKDNDKDRSENAPKKPPVRQRFPVLPNNTGLRSSKNTEKPGRCVFLFVSSHVCLHCSEHLDLYSHRIRLDAEHINNKADTGNNRSEDELRRRLRNTRPSAAPYAVQLQRGTSAFVADR